MTIVNPFSLVFGNDGPILTFAGFFAIEQIFRVVNEQSQPSYDANFNFVSYYNWTGLPGSLPGMVVNGGNGEPKGFTGMVGTSHRPSDDLSVYGK
jgi:meiotically up-regulated gene 157 (Mug157) protein